MGRYVRKEPEFSIEAPSYTEDSEKLLERLKNLESRLITNALLCAELKKATGTLKRIFGKNNQFSEFLDEYDTVGCLQKFEKALDKPLKIATGRAKTEGYKNLSVNKNSILHGILTDTNKVNIRKVRVYLDYFDELEDGLDEALTKGDTKTTKKLLQGYVELLEANENYLIENLKGFSLDIRNVWSIQNSIAHEMAHNIYATFNKDKGRLHYAIIESYSFAIQFFSHTFEDDFQFTKKT